MSQYTHRGKIENCKLVFANPERWLVSLGKLNGKKVELTLQEAQSKRTDRQNRYYHGVICRLLGDHCGYTPDEMHEILKHKFLASPPDENGLVMVKSTTALSTNEFIQFTNEVAIWANDLNCRIPPPGGVYI